MLQLAAEQSSEGAKLNGSPMVTEAVNALLRNPHSLFDPDPYYEAHSLAATGPQRKADPPLFW